MLAGFFFGTTVKSLRRQAEGIALYKERIERVEQNLQENKNQAIADRQAAIRAAQEEILVISAI